MEIKSKTINALQIELDTKIKQNESINQEFIILGDQYQINKNELIKN